MKSLCGGNEELTAMTKYHIPNKNSKKEIKKFRIKPLPIGLMLCASKTSKELLPKK